MTYLMRKGGIPALAYPISSAALPSLCTLLIKCSETSTQLTITLQFSIFIHGFDDEQLCTLVYDADNLQTGTTSIRKTTSLPQARLEEIARHGNPIPRILSLTLKKPCPVQCPPSSGSIAPKHGFGAQFRQLVVLAKALEVHVLFDNAWLRRENLAQLQKLIRHPERLIGYAGLLDRSARLYRQADWTVFSPVEDAVSEAPPSYAADASNKRPRQVDSSPGSPSHKRVLISTEPLSSTPPFIQSPTEKATTIPSTPSPRPARSSPPAIAPDFHEAVRNAVESLLPDALQTILPQVLPQVLPDILARMFVVPPSILSSPSSSQLQHSSFRSVEANADPASTFHALMRNHIATATTSHLHSLETSTLEHAAYLRAAADAEFAEELADNRLDVAIAKEDAIKEIEHTIDEKLAEMRANANEIVESCEEKAEEVFAGLCGKVEYTDSIRLKRQVLERMRMRGREVQVTAGHQRRRAASMPL
jgi:hypothetical protein